MTFHIPKAPAVPVPFGLPADLGSGFRYSAPNAGTVTPVPSAVDSSFLAGLMMAFSSLAGMPATAWRVLMASLTAPEKRVAPLAIQVWQAHDQSWNASLELPSLAPFTAPSRLGAVRQAKAEALRVLAAHIEHGAEISFVDALFDEVVAISAPSEKTMSDESAAALASLRALADNWDEEGAEAPSSDAIACAEQLVAAGHSVELEPLHIDPDVMGGVGVCFSWPPGHADGQASRWAWVFFLNSKPGGTAVLRQRTDESSSTLRVDPKDVGAAVERIMAFLKGA